MISNRMVYGLIYCTKNIPYRIKINKINKINKWINNNTMNINKLILILVIVYLF